MIKYNVKRDYTELGVHHELGTVIIDESLILNLPVKLWDGTLVKEEVTETPKDAVKSPNTTTITTVSQAPANSTVTPQDK